MAVEAATVGPQIDRVEPNPVTDRDVGEYIVLELPTPTDLSGWSVTVGNRSARLPSATVDGRIAVGAHPRVSALLTDLPTVGWTGHLPLPADGATLTLRDAEGQVVDEVTYGPTADGVGWDRNGSAEGGPTVDQVEPRDASEATVFVLPDGPVAVLDIVLAAEERLWLSGYEFSDPAVRDVLLARHAAGVDVRVLVDGRPVGGQSVAERAALDDLTAAGIPTRVLDRPGRHYDHYHPKYAIADDTALVMSENWKPAGTGGAASRGWGIAVPDRRVAADLAAIFGADFDGGDARAWDRHPNGGIDVERNETRPLPVDHHAPASVTIEAAEVLAAPEHGEERLLALIAEADTRIDVQQVGIDGIDFPLVRALLEAAERGVRVRIHLDRSWYNEEENEAVAAALTSAAADDDLPLEATLADPAGRYERVHNKGMVIDDRTVVVGSLNWNNVSLRENREVVLVVEGEEAAAYYRAVFEGDWRPPERVTPVGFVVFVATLWIGAGLVATRRITFRPD